MAQSLQYIYIYKYYNIIVSHNKENFQNNICINMHFGFNNQFIQAMRTRPIFQKLQKIILFSCNIWDCDLYVKRIPNIKNKVFVQTLEQLGFYMLKIRISLPRRTFLEPQTDQQLEAQKHLSFLSDNKTIQLTLGRAYLGC